jgi:putative flavoprotein involved in K+ transport
VLGLPYLRRRKSSFMHGAEDDVRELGAHLAAHLGDYIDEETYSHSIVAGGLEEMS